MNFDAITLLGVNVPEVSLIDGNVLDLMIEYLDNRTYKNNIRYILANAMIDDVYDLVTCVYENNCFNDFATVANDLLIFATNFDIDGRQIVLIFLIDYLRMLMIEQ